MSQLDAPTFKTNERCHIYHTCRCTTVRVFITRQLHRFMHILRSRGKKRSDLSLTPRRTVTRVNTAASCSTNRTCHPWARVNEHLSLTRLDTISTYTRSALNHRLMPAPWYFHVRATKRYRAPNNFIRDNDRIPTTWFRYQKSGKY